MDKGKVLIVEDELLTATHIAQILSDEGYDVLEPVIKGEHVPGIVTREHPDIIIMDIQLAGSLDGLETAKIISETSDVAIIFLTSNSDRTTFEKSKESSPYAFLSKPFKEEEILRTVDLVLNRHRSNVQNPNDKVSGLQDTYVFVTSKSRKIRLRVEDILYVKADRNYCTIFTDHQQHVLSLSLAAFERKIPGNILTRIHRSYLVNLALIDSLDEHYVFFQKTAIPIGKSYRKILQSKIRTL